MNGIGYEGVLSEEANIQYRARDMEEVFEVIGDIIEHHINYQRPRLKVLDEYYKGRNVGIYSRAGRTNKSKADNRQANPYAKYISQFIQGYITGIPVKVDADDELMKEVLRRTYEGNDIDTLNSEIVLDLTKYGRAYELLFYNERQGDRNVQLDVENTFVIYDTSVTMQELCGVHYRLSDDYGRLGGLEDRVRVDVSIYTENYTYILEPTYLRDFEVIVDQDRSRHHSYGEVPIIEYRVDKARQGDYEQVLSLIDGYDKASSDISNFLSDFNEAMLMFNGATEGIDWETISADLSDGTILEVNTGVDANGEPKKVDVGYLTREYDYNGADSYLNRKSSDIHKFTHIPDMSDESFANNTSGIAIQYKLIGLEQVAGKKMRAMERGFNKRYRMVVNSKEFLEEVTGVEDRKVQYKWTVNIPENIEDELKAFKDAGGELSQSTLLSTLSFINNAEDEKKRILAEKLGVTVEEINKLRPEELRYVLSRVRGEDTVNVLREEVQSEGEEVQAEGEEEEAGTKHEQGVDALYKILDGEK